MFYALGIAVILGALSAFFFPKKLRPNKRSISISELHQSCLVRNGPVCATLMRQSGEPYRDLGIFADTTTACNEVTKSLRKAQIDSLVIWQNSEQTFEVHRKIFNGRGRAEGKKLGGAIIVAI